MMNKILTVGHPQSGYRNVERILLSCGMQEPEVSKKDNLSPVEIGELLRKAHGLASVADISQGDDMQQLDAGPVWNGLALDLLMGNIDQKFWGWSDPEAIWLLDYWKSLDPKMVFVLVYDEPHRVLTEAGCDEAKLFSREIVERRLDNWNVYNNALLGFYLRNRERSILVNATQVRQTAEACLNELKPWFDDHLLPSAHPHTNGTFRPVFSRNGEGRAARGASKALSVSALTVPALADGFLVESILAEYPEHLQRYEELQASATIPLPESTNNYPEALEAWLIQMKRRSETVRVLSILAEGKHRAEEQLLVKEQELASEQERLLGQLQATEQQLMGARQQAGKLREEVSSVGNAKQEIEEKNGALQSQFHQLQVELSSSGKANGELSEENKLLLSQLHQVQEELERIYLENEKNKKVEAEKAESEKKVKLLEEEKGSLERKLKDLQQQTGKLHEEVKSASKAKGEIEEENKLLLVQLHKVQEELERLYVANDEYKKVGSEKALFEQQARSLEVEKGRLSEELGLLKAESGKLQAEVGKSVQARKELDEENKLLLVQLHKVQEELERYYLQNQELQRLLNPVWYGAAERLKSELPYQLGLAIIEQSQKVWSLLFLPISISRIARDYKKQQKQQTEPLPPLYKYRDYNDADKARKHLSYRLGEAWLKHNRTPLGWVTMPFALSKARREFLDYRKSKGK